MLPQFYLKHAFFVNFRIRIPVLPTRLLTLPGSPSACSTTRADSSLGRPTSPGHHYLHRLSSSLFTPRCIKLMNEQLANSNEGWNKLRLACIWLNSNWLFWAPFEDFYHIQIEMFITIQSFEDALPIISDPPDVSLDTDRSNEIPESRSGTLRTNSYSLQVWCPPLAKWNDSTGAISSGYPSPRRTEGKDILCTKSTPAMFSGLGPCKKCFHRLPRPQNKRR